MSNFPKRKRTHYFLFLFPALFFISCSSAKSKWQLETIEADCPCTTYSKLSFSPCSRFNGIKVEFLYDGLEQTLFLNALTLEFPEPDPQGYLEVSFSINGERYTFPAEYLEGGQRLRLPKEALELTANALLNDAQVEISVGRYQVMLEMDNFALLYRT